MLATAIGFDTLGQETNQPPAAVSQPAQVDYSAFRIIAERNIFAARRSGRTTRGAPRVQRRTETFTLVGTLESGNGAIAFFDGTSAEYRKALKPGDAIAGFKIASISFGGIVLATDAGTTELRVGAQMRLDDEGHWRTADPTTPYLGTTSESVATALGAGDPNEPATIESSGPANEILRRLMQQREQELR